MNNLNDLECGNCKCLFISHDLDFDYNLKCQECNYCYDFNFQSLELSKNLTKSLNNIEIYKSTKIGASQFLNGYLPTHSPTRCKGSVCVIHNPNTHPMVAWPWLIDRNWMIWRLCPHAIRHPDPDSLRYFERNDRLGEGIHMCDACCDV